eukprot:m.477943 g.477943  ORF g.477943 m.477943 type:complete len:226 (+) comp21689_c0_seq17:1303-1980(+)
MRPGRLVRWVLGSVVAAACMHLLPALHHTMHCHTNAARRWVPSGRCCWYANAEAREEILHTQTRKLLLADDVNLGTIASDAYTTGFTGADLAAVTREAGTLALRRVVLALGAGPAEHAAPAAMSITSADILNAVRQVSPSVSAKDLRRYRAMQGKLRGKRGSMGAAQATTDTGATDAPGTDGGPHGDGAVAPPSAHVQSDGLPATAPSGPHASEPGGAARMHTEN